MDKGEVIPNKKAVYDPTKSQRFRQIVCSRGWAIGILLLIEAVMVASESSSTNCSSNVSNITSTSIAEIPAHENPQTYIATNGEPFPWRDLRLPKTVIPEAYSIFLHANITDSYFIGNIHMTLRVEQRTDFIVFHSKELNISNIKVFVAVGNNVSFLNFNSKIGVLKELEYPRNEQYYLKLAALLQESTYVQVQADFRGSLASLSKSIGFFKSSYTIYGKERYIASTQFEATYARLAFPCLDEPDLKAKFTMSMVRDHQHITLFNMPLKRTAPYHSDLVVDEYEETVKMSTYLVAFVICDFKNISAQTKDGTKVSVFAREDKINMGEIALRAAVTLLEYYTDFFETHYPLPKLDMIAVPSLDVRVMEDWGLITFRESSLLYDSEISMASAKQGIVATVAHELAHQWFGNLVTMKWWNDLWLNEGFATFVENEYGTDVVDPSFRQKDIALLGYLGALNKDSLPNSHPVAVAVNDPVEIASVFDTISYQKGSALIRMLKNFLKEVPFHKGLRRYLQKYKFGNAETSDLWESFEDEAGSDLPPPLTVSKIMDTWINQMGFPVVTVSRQEGKLHLSQQRFLLNERSKDASHNGKILPSPFGYKWIIPVTYTTSEDPTKQNLAWLSEEQTQLKLDNGSARWLKANVDIQGFYRVNYDKNGWQSIIQQLSENHTVFTVADRIGLIDDAFNLAKAGLTDYKIALDLTKYLVHETDYFVLSVAIRHIRFVEEKLFMEEEFHLLKNYILSLIKAHINYVTWNEQKNQIDDYMQSLMIGTAARLEYKPVIDKALEIFDLWRNGVPIKVSNGLRDTVFSQGVIHGTTSDWDLVFHRYTKEVVPSERNNLLTALGASHNAKLLQLLLKYSLDDTKIKPQDSERVLTTVAVSPYGQLFAWRFLRENYDTLIERLGSSSSFMPPTVPITIASFNTQFDYDEVAAFFKNKKLGTARKTLEKYMEYIKNNIDWINDYMATIKTWLHELVKP